MQEFTDEKRPAKIECWWRYLGKFYYFAVRVHTTKFTPGGVDGTSSFLVPRLSHTVGGDAKYLGMLALDEEHSIMFDFLNVLDASVAGVRVTDSFVEYEFATVAPTRELSQPGAVLNVHLDYYAPAWSGTRCSFVLSEETAETAPPEPDPTETDPTDPEASAPAGETDGAAASSAAVPVIVGTAAAVMAAVIVIVIAKKKKK